MAQEKIISASERLRNRTVKVNYERHDHTVNRKELLKELKKAGKTYSDGAVLTRTP